MNYIEHGIRWNDLLLKKRRHYGDRFDKSGLIEKWVPAFCTGQRIRVRLPGGEVKTGTVGVTAGRKPVFLLMLTRRSLGSSIILDNNVVFTNDKMNWLDMCSDCGADFYCQTLAPRPLALCAECQERRREQEETGGLLEF